MLREARKHVATLATMGNLASGCMALVLTLEGRPDLAALLVIAAVLLDSVDGALARAFDACSEFGAELDSLADVVSFGVAPALLVVSLQDREHPLGWALPLCFALAAGWRLARFNVHRPRSIRREGFVGLPTTGAGACVAAAVLAQSFLAEHGIEVAAALLPWLAFTLAMLMVSNVPYAHVGTLIAKWPVAFAVAAAATLWVGVTQGAAREVLFLTFALAYVASGPAAAVGAKVRSLREVHSG